MFHRSNLFSKKKTYTILVFAVYLPSAEGGIIGNWANLF